MLLFHVDCVRISECHTSGKSSLTAFTGHNVSTWRYTREMWGFKHHHAQVCLQNWVLLLIKTASSHLPHSLQLLCLMLFICLSWFYVITRLSFRVWVKGIPFSLFLLVVLFFRFKVSILAPSMLRARNSCNSSGLSVGFLCLFIFPRYCRQQGRWEVDAGDTTSLLPFCSQITLSLVVYSPAFISLNPSSQSTHVSADYNMLPLLINIFPVWQ